MEASSTDGGVKIGEMAGGIRLGHQLAFRRDVMLCILYVNGGTKEIEIGSLLMERAFYEKRLRGRRMM